MDTLISSYSPAMSDYSFVPSPEIELSSLFEQCGIPLADLHAQISPSKPTTKGSCATWYEGTAPADGDVVELEEGDRPDLSGREIKEKIKIERHDGLGSDHVSTPNEGHPVVVSPRCPPARRLLHDDDQHETLLHEADGRSLTSPHTTAPRRQSQHSADKSSFITAPSPGRSSQSTIFSPPAEGLERTQELDDVAPAARQISMDYYTQHTHQPYFAGPQLSSPVSINSPACGMDMYVYTPEFSATQDTMLSGAQVEAEVMRRSRSTPFPTQRTRCPSTFSPEQLYALSSAPTYADFPALPVSQQEFVPASEPSQWLSSGEYLLTSADRHQQLHETATKPLPVRAARPNMKRKHRPMPIATSLSAGGFMGAQTAPLERRDIMRRTLPKSPLSAKRSFEDFSELDDGLVDVPPYRHVATPTTKKARSHQGFKQSIPASPFLDEPLFSPGYSTSNTNGLALSMDPERFLLSSPPYSQTDFCSSPNYLLQSTPSSIDSFTMPHNMMQQQQEQAYVYQPLSPLDIDGIWAQKPVFNRPAQIVSQPVYTTPRSLTYGAPSPSRKPAVRQTRKPSMARAISFCNYTAADKKTILSGVAPSGSNKKAMTKAQEMSRSQSQGISIAAA